MSYFETKGLCRYFGGLKAVDDVSISVEKGDIFGIIGPNGAGKTTFFNICAGTYAATAGEVWFEGENITNRKPYEISQIGISRTFQNLKIFTEMSVAENIAVGFHGRTKTNVFDAILKSKRFKTDEQLVKEETEKILDLLGLTDLGDELAGNLSYGTQRRVEIGRTMAVNPKIIMLDEPAAGMNPLETQTLMEFIRKLNVNGYTIIVIEHDMKFIMNLCNRIAVLNSGHMICEGTPNEVKNNAEVQEAYLGKGLHFIKARSDSNA